MDIYTKKSIELGLAVSILYGVLFIALVAFCEMASVMSVSFVLVIAAIIGIVHGEMQYDEFTKTE